MGKDDSARAAMDLHNVMYTRAIHNIAADYAAKNYSDFAVVVQPCFQDLPVLALEYLSGVDCFHPSHVAHAAMGIGLWNNMMQAEGQKDQTLDPSTVKILCPAGESHSYVLFFHLPLQAVFLNFFVSPQSLADDQYIS